MDFLCFLIGKLLTAASTTPRPPSRYAYGINLKILHHLLLDLSYSQTCVSTLPAQRDDNNAL